MAGGIIMKGNKTINAYIKFFKNKPATGFKHTELLMQEYLQKVNSDGYGYINLALCLEEETDNYLKEKFKSYYNFLNSEDVVILMDKTGMSKEEILNVSTKNDRKGLTQKWHLLISYLCMSWYLGDSIKPSFISCPELLMWMVESSGLFNEADIKAFYQAAVSYRNKEISYHDWREFKNEYYTKINGNVMESYN